MCLADGEFRASAIAEFVSANKIPLITTLTQETAPAIFDNPIKKQVCHAVCLGVLFSSCSRPMYHSFADLLSSNFEIRFCFLLLRRSPQNFCPSSRKQQNHSRGRYFFLLIGPMFHELFSSVVFHALYSNPSHHLFPF